MMCLVAMSSNRGPSTSLTLISDSDIAKLSSFLSGTKRFQVVRHLEYFPERFRVRTPVSDLLRRFVFGFRIRVWITTYCFVKWFLVDAPPRASPQAGPQVHQVSELAGKVWERREPLHAMECSGDRIRPD